MSSQGENVVLLLPYKNQIRYVRDKDGPIFDFEEIFRSGNASFPSESSDHIDIVGDLLAMFIRFTSSDLVTARCKAPDAFRTDSANLGLVGCTSDMLLILSAVSYTRGGIAIPDEDELSAFSLTFSVSATPLEDPNVG